MKADSSADLYVYCVGYAEPLRAGPVQARGVGGSPVHVVECGDLAAVVSELAGDYQRISRDNILAHERVIEEAMSRCDILPAAFGLVAPGEDELRERLLQDERAALHEALEYVRGRVQLGLTVLWNEKRLFSEIVAEDASIRALRDVVSGHSGDATYYERIRIGELTEAAIASKRMFESQALLNALEPLAVETVIKDNISELMILSAAFLVEKNGLEGFDDEVDALGRSQAERLILRYVGPLPPYDFVNLSVNWEK